MSSNSTATRRYRWFPLCFVAPVLLAACSSNGSEAQTTSEPSSSAGSTGCTAVAANSAAKPPADIPTPSDATFYETSKVGATTLYFAYSPGDDVKQRRDAIKEALEQASYEIKGTDAEDNEEAELEFEGKGHGESSVQVIHREGCESQLRLRFRIGA
ncbi:MAG: hypothetical protein QOG53_3080 [Frankiales bacterium]|jgi:hypothetical protein|nr:hypothetical protein [Frankiales bacterium]